MSVSVESFAHRDFSKKLLDTFHSSALVAGSDQVAAGLDKLRKNGAKFEALEARFQLGRDNAAYLRSNIMPLQAANEADDRQMTSGIAPELLAAGRQGILLALKEELKQSQKKSNDTIEDQLLFVAWLLSVPEIREFVDNHLQSRINTSAPSASAEDAARQTDLNKALNNARSIALSFADSTDPEGAAEAFLSRDPKEVEEIVLSLLVLWHQPMQVVENQYEATVGKTVQRVGERIDAVASAAGVSRKAFEANNVAVPSLVRDGRELKRIPAKTINDVGKKVQEQGFYTTLQFQQQVDLYKEAEKALTSQLLEAARTLARLKEDFQAQGEELKTSEAEEAKLRKEIEAWEGQVKALEGELSTTKTSLAQVEAQRQKLQAENDALYEQLAQARGQTERLQRQVADFTVLVRDYNRQIDEKKKETEEMRKDLLAQQQKLRVGAAAAQASLQNEIASLERQLAAADVQIKQIQDAKTQAEAQTVNVQERLDRAVEVNARDAQRLFVARGVAQDDARRIAELEDDLRKATLAAKVQAAVRTLLVERYNELKSEYGRTERALLAPDENIEFFERELRNLGVQVADARAEEEQAEAEVEQVQESLTTRLYNALPVTGGQVAAGVLAAGAAVATAGFAYLTQPPEETQDPGYLQNIAPGFNTASAVDQELDALFPVPKRRREMHTIGDVGEWNSALPAADETADVACGVETGTVSFEQVEQALVAAMLQLREAGGVGLIGTQTLRVSGVSPFWSSGEQRAAVQRIAGFKDGWTRHLFPTGAPMGGPQEISRRLGAAARGEVNDIDQTAITSNAATSFAVVRGLCAERGPHHRVAGTTLQYNLPKVKYTAPPQTSLPATAVAREFEVRDASFRRQSVQPAIDFCHSAEVLASAAAPAARQIPEKPCKWTPVEEAPAVYTGTASKTFNVSRDPTHKDVASAVVYEKMVDYFNFKHTASPSQELIWKAAAAAAKVKQLQHLVRPLQAVDNPCPSTIKSKVGTDDEEEYLFCTRPVVECLEGTDKVVAYPMDAGFAAFVNVKPTKKKFEVANLSAPLTSATEANQLPATVRADGTHEYVSRAELSKMLRRMTDGNASKGATVYLAPAPGLVRSQEKYEDNQALRSVNRDDLPKEEDIGQLHPDKVQEALRALLQHYKKIENYKCEDEYLDAELAKHKAGDNANSLEEMARERRGAVWNDALREAAIAGDRLWAFVRQFSGTISEPVDAVCQIDEGALVRQQQQVRDQRKLLAQRAADQHLQLVRNVFQSVIKDSGLTLGIGADGEVGDLRVVSNTLRKQATDLTRNQQSDGFFSGAVALENLLQQGTGEMSLNDLFQKLSEAGVELQKAVISNEAFDGVNDGGVSLQFLSAPRNSLLLRWKPESHAAVNRSFTLFINEWRAKYSYLREPLVWELMEGVDDHLCTLFASLCAYVLAWSRMSSSSQAQYVGAWATASTAHQARIALQRCINQCARYVKAHHLPGYSKGDRELYFK